LSRNRGQPKREFQAERYGASTELDIQQSGAPMAKVEEPELEAVEETQQVSPALGNLLQDAYRSTERPFEPSNTRLSATDAPFLATDADMILQAMYRVLPSKEIAALLRNL
tara:strand:+ start:141 stop:473 length:333 start_codon:yes stop_codon:yes gene_type:complete